jgi:amidophosphoribosyltransferase
MATFDGERFREHKGNGLVKDVINKDQIEMLQGNMGIGHVRYPTAGSTSAQEAQPFFVSSPLGIYLVRARPFGS